MKPRYTCAAIRCAKRATLLAFDALCLGLIAAIVLLGVPAPAFAYVDPSVMTYTIQAVAGVAVALSAVAGVAFRRSRRRIMKLLKLDENAHKTADPSWSRVEHVEGNRFNDVTGKQAVASDTYAKSETAQREGKKPSTKLRWRLLLAVLASAFLVVTLLILAPFEILAGSEASLALGLADAWVPILCFAGAVFVVLTLLLTLLRGRAFEIALAVVFCFSLCCYIQALFLNNGLPTTDGRVVDWGRHRMGALVSTVVWVLVFVAVCLVGKKNRKIAHACIGVLAAALIVVQGVAAGSLLHGKLEEHSDNYEGPPPASSYHITENGMFSLSPDGNVVVFLLDTFDTQDMIQLLEDEPEFAQRLQGFTWFEDSVGSLCPTRYGAPFLNSGVYPRADESFQHFLSRRYTDSTYLGDIEKSGYSIGIYSDSLGTQGHMSDDDQRTVYDKTINVKPVETPEISYLDEMGTVRIMIKAALYRDMPWLIKPYCYFDTDQVNQSMVAWTEGGKDTESVTYVMDDARWFQMLKENGLTLDDSDQYSGAYRYIHLSGTHEPYTIDENGERVQDDSGNLRDQARGSLRMVCDYLDEMKRLGVYEDATVIITADHGIWKEWEVGYPLAVQSSLMLAKPSGVSEGDLTVSDADITAYDVLPTVIQAVGGDAGSYGPTLFEQSDGNRDRYYYLTHCVNNYDILVEEYLINGFVLDESSWTATGNVWDPNVP